MFMDAAYLRCLDPVFRKKLSGFLGYGHKVLGLQVLKGREACYDRIFGAKPVPCRRLPSKPGPAAFPSLLHVPVLLVCHGIVPPLK